MNARTPETALSIESFNPAMPLAWISSSPTNPRKRFDQASMDELTANVKLHGVLTPVLVRPSKDGVGYELVFGERRFRAAAAAGLETIPTTIRDLTDVEVIEIQIIENLQRADVHPIEEAEGYERLMAQTKPDGHHYTADDIAAKVGKSRRYVYNRLQLTKLCPEAREAFYDGKIDIKKAEAISRIGHHDTQRAALKDVSHEHVSSRDAMERIRRFFMLEIKYASFDAKKADYQVKGKVIAGPCGTCPKRTGNNPDLFGEINGKDVCTDIKCYEAKRDAAMELRRQKYEAAGKKVITGKEAKEIFPHEYSRQPERGYVLPETSLWDMNAAEKNNGKSYAKLLGKELPTVLVQNPHSKELVELVDKSAATKLLKAKGIIKAPKKDTSTSNASPIKGLPNRAQENAMHARGYRMAREQLAAGASEADFRFLIKVALTSLIDFGGDAEVIGPIYAPDEFAALADSNRNNNYDLFEAVIKRATTAIDALPAAELPRVLIDINAQMCCDSFDNMADLEALNKRYGITKKQITKQLEADAKAKEAAKAAAVKPTEPVMPVIEPLIKPAKKAAKAK